MGISSRLVGWAVICGGVAAGIKKVTVNKQCGNHLRIVMMSIKYNT